MKKIEICTLLKQPNFPPYFLFKSCLFSDTSPPPPCSRNTLYPLYLCGYGEKRPHYKCDDKVSWDEPRAATGASLSTCSGLPPPPCPFSPTSSTVPVGEEAALLLHHEWLVEGMYPRSFLLLSSTTGMSACPPFHQELGQRMFPLPPMDKCVDYSLPPICCLDSNTSPA